MNLLKVSAVILPVFVIFSWQCFLLVHRVTESPYIDEEFHVPQAQRYCRADYQWDPKITTPPGLYLASLALLRVSNALGLDLHCDIFFLRLTNVVFASCNFIVLTLIMSKLNKGSLSTGALELANLSTFPILYFFSFLYYTDVISTLSVLLMYCAFLHNKIILSAMLGFVSLWMRQTNVIWVAFAAAIHGYNLLDELLKKDKVRRGKNEIFGRVWAGLQRPHVVSSIVLQETPFIAVGASFAAFVAWNGGIVLGDKSAHEATVHLPQLLYFSAMCAALAPATFAAAAPRFLRLTLRQPAATVLAAAAVAAVVHLNSTAHPYLLADNRHYTFYLWRRLLQPAGFLLAPLYLFTGHTLLTQLARHGLFLQLLFAVCAAAAVVPQALLEPRYFVMPFIFYKIHAPETNCKLSAVNVLVSLLVNVFTVYVYVYCPFTPESKVRFIW
ncbi:Hypothetical predicted protein [Cloeon dipterum]|uniref:Dol-P-Glc:Glc(2)Man(9)GlcNAc(2)-PP-Dol alpha-1,2-glucosyltransferase n=1 Tax=Cloeon dipterum TaxID=197152 RepID=A0A8S1DCL8_9INSE|nr:Hypothetical predicted protein [Cloeon dipterum]